ncbi:hypothetical protein S7711_02007 [Stachybotrys chartarum IBT 7711]|uniref:O-methyltransferase C-terminal domain-containing protein n=1 Tax=Stachybotrys chartarum (strain CBS 109288 / IBT 7711) TaxID=1280523 RepID=A0A084AVY9_STACB|nr:hypothetical protein S7711_02007 [Stachybotrys chartarum IBT 7711]KFA47375.1 hypothetical protein S40293_07603 [Stachybotrys chartarum IBT 40293]KFA78229.1 hypothetical protein S40288_02673 [Stachybotrys chartarum IBT 40288]
MGNTVIKESPAPTTTLSSLNKLTALSKNIEEKTKILTEELRSKGLEAPSFSPTGPADFPLSEVSLEVLQARDDVIAQAKELHDILLSPRVSLKTFAWDSINYIALHAIVEFRIAEAVPRTGSISFQDLAPNIEKLSGNRLPYTDLRRLLRLATNNNIFYEPHVGFVAHNRTSLLLLDDEAVANWVGMCTVDNLPYIANAVAAMKKWPGSQESDETAVNVAHNHNLRFFEHVKSDPIRARRYDLAMAAHGAREGFELCHTVQSYPWDGLGSAVVVDVGGSDGLVSAALAAAFPSLSFIVQDLAGVHTPATQDNIPKQLSDRVTLATHDCFEEQPVVARAYFFRHVFHAFSDKYAILILKALIPALRPGARVIINDMVLPTPGEVSHLEERSARVMDVLMQTVCNSRERDVDDWRQLFQLADARFKWQGAWKSSGRLWFIEARWECD